LDSCLLLTTSLSVNCINFRCCFDDRKPCWSILFLEVKKRITLFSGFNLAIPFGNRSRCCIYSHLKFDVWLSLSDARFQLNNRNIFFGAQG
jgi:hypothetical protein